MVNLASLLVVGGLKRARRDRPMHRGTCRCRAQNHANASWAERTITHTKSDNIMKKQNKPSAMTIIGGKSSVSARIQIGLRITN